MGTFLDKCCTCNTNDQTIEHINLQRRPSKIDDRDFIDIRDNKVELIIYDSDD